MSHYVDEYAVLSAIKAILDADSTLNTLLNVKGSSSKVILGMERPDVCAMPTIHLSFLTRNIDPETKMNNVLYRVTWFANALPGPLEDIDTLANIGERIYDLLDDVLPTVSGHKIQVNVAESGENPAKDIQEPEGRPNHFQSLTFRMVVKRNT
jgi:hypothetical protein